MFKKIFMLTVIFSLAGFMSCGNFLTGPNLDNDPNRATEVPTDNLFVGMQVSAYTVLEGHLNRTVTMYMQQMAGVAQHYEGYDVYNQLPTQFGGAWLDVYGGGGLVDMRKVEKNASDGGQRVLLGITKMWEALIMSTAADLWGDIPYSQAINSDYPKPKYDKQSDVHDAILNLIDGAIADLQAGQTKDINKYDFTFHGDVTKWIAAAHTLKARILLNWAEVKQGNYALAMAEAQQGIASDADNWKALHSDINGEESVWWQFNSVRFGYVKAGNYLVELLKTQNDPRLQVYFGTDPDGNYSGSKPGELNGSVSFLNENTFGAKSYGLEFVSWYENQFIIAECQYATGDENGARNTVNDVIQPGLEAKWGLAANSLPRIPDAATGVDLLAAIMLEKYKAMFLNIQIFSDWRRTAFPIFPITALGKRIPRRMLYSDDELNTNSGNVTNLGWYTRVENDPGNPTYPGRTVNP